MALKHNPLTDSHREVVASLSQRAIESTLSMLKREDELTLALRDMHRMGVCMDDLSAASGLPPAEIRRRLDCELHLGEDIDRLAGLR